MTVPMVDPDADDYQERIADILINKVSGVDHIAFASTDTDCTIEVLSLLGFETAIYKKTVERFNILATKMINVKSDVIEIVEVLDRSKRSPIDNFIKDNQSQVYHVCYKVDDFDKAYRALVALETLVVTKPFESYLFDGYRVSHMHNESIGLFEIFGRIR
ncbi:hypothetical protein A9Q81_09900 [Gammaproteobacteria bacterium 42_54_T18]|nr:hypothetical protein A9Q81_09900 [Gammaproteobacteria bacterium 42_54_T18]